MRRRASPIDDCPAVLAAEASPRSHSATAALSICHPFAPLPRELARRTMGQPRPIQASSVVGETPKKAPMMVISFGDALVLRAALDELSSDENAASVAASLEEELLGSSGERGNGRVA